MKVRPFIAAAGIVAGLSIAACAPPAPVMGLVQHTACNPDTVGDIHHLDGCVHWINHNAAWNYPPETEWAGPFSDYLYDLTHGNGAELLP